MPLFALRCLAIFGTTTAVLVLPRPWLMTAIVILGLTHYLLAFYYARRVASRLLSRWKSALAFLMLALLTAFVTWSRVPAILFFFGIHHVLSEYFMPRSIHAEIGAQEKRFGWSLRSLFHVLLYGSATRYFSETAPVPGFWAVLAGVTLIFYAIWLMRKAVPQKVKLDMILSETLLLVAVHFTASQHKGLMLVLLYHFILWTFFPLWLTSRAKTVPAWGRFALETLGAAGVVVGLLLATGGLWGGTFLGNMGTKGLALLTTIGYVHIGLTFGFSQQNPAWLTRIFRS